jgi:hypothetical protein
MDIKLTHSACPKKSGALHGAQILSWQAQLYRSIASIEFLKNAVGKDDAVG